MARWKTQQKLDPGSIDGTRSCIPVWFCTCIISDRLPRWIGVSPSDSEKLHTLFTMVTLVWWGSLLKKPNCEEEKASLQASFQVATIINQRWFIFWYLWVIWPKDKMNPKTHCYLKAHSHHGAALSLRFRCPNFPSFGVFHIILKHQYKQQRADAEEEYTSFHLIQENNWEIRMELSYKSSESASLTSPTRNYMRTTRRPTHTLIQTLEHTHMQKQTTKQTNKQTNTQTSKNTGMFDTYTWAMTLENCPIWGCNSENEGSITDGPLGSEVNSALPICSGVSLWITNH